MPNVLNGIDACLFDVDGGGEKWTLKLLVMWPHPNGGTAAHDSRSRQ